MNEPGAGVSRLGGQLGVRGDGDDGAPGGAT